MNIEKRPIQKNENPHETEISSEYVLIAEQALRGYLALKPEEKIHGNSIQTRLREKKIF